MLKKMLMVMLVLAAGSVALAGDLAISVGGQDAPPDSTIYLQPSQHIELDIHAGADLASGWTCSWALIVNTNAGSIGSTGTVNPAYDMIEDPPVDIAMVAIAMGYGDSVPEEERPFPMVAGVNGMFGGIAVFDSPGIASGTWLLKDIDFHCVAMGDALIQLIQLNDETGWPTGLVYDTLTIHQIPEPATMVLLSLGGLLLKKRGK